MPSSARCASRGVREGRTPPMPLATAAVSSKRTAVDRRRAASEHVGEHTGRCNSACEPDDTSPRLCLRPGGSGSRYGGAVDVPFAADLYAQGWTLRQIAAELGRTETTVSDQRERTRAVAATSAAHSQHLIWVMMAYGLSPAGGVYLDRYELEGLASKMLSFRSPTVCRTPHCRRHLDSFANRDEPNAGLRLVTVAPWTLTVQLTCTPRAGPCTRSVLSWAFRGLP
jgi:hypothetical protein